MANKRNKNIPQNSGKSFWPFIYGFLVGGAVGAIAGILLSPKSGIEMRHQFSESFGDVQNKTRELLDNSKVSWERAADISGKTLDNRVSRVTEAFKAGRRAAQNEKIDLEEKVEVDQNSLKSVTIHGYTISDTVNVDSSEDNEKDSGFEA